MYEEQHELYRASVRAFIEAEVTPHYLQWESDGIAPRSLYTSAGALGFLGTAVPEEHGGGKEWVLHNDEKVAISQGPPLEMGYLYLYQRKA